MHLQLCMSHNVRGLFYSYGECATCCLECFGVVGSCIWWVLRERHLYRSLLYRSLLFCSLSSSLPPRTKQALIIKANEPTYVPAGMHATGECVKMFIQHSCSWHYSVIQLFFLSSSSYPTMCTEGGHLKNTFGSRRFFSDGSAREIMILTKDKFSVWFFESD